MQHIASLCVQAATHCQHIRLKRAQRRARATVAEASTSALDAAPDLKFARNDRCQIIRSDCQIIRSSTHSILSGVPIMEALACFAQIRSTVTAELLKRRQ